MAKFWDSVGDLFGNVIKGAMKSLEGIYDFHAGTVGLVGGWFDDEFEKDVREHITYDWTGNNTKFLNGVEKDSVFGDTVRNIAGGVGGMLPSVALSFIPYAGPALSTGALMMGAAGNSMESSLNEGAGYGNAFMYGVGKGVVEGATEKLGGYVLGGGTSKVGKAITGTKFGNAVSKGVGKVAFDAASEGAEEVVSDVVIDPGLKFVTGVDKNIGENYKQAIKDAPEIFGTGVAVGSIMQGGTTAITNIANSAKGRGGAKATRADNAVQNILEVTKNYTGVRNTDFKYDNAVKFNLETVSSELVKMSPEARKNYLDSIGVYKNAFDRETGRLKENSMPYAHREAITANLRTFSGHLSHKPLKGTESITNGAKTAKKTVERVVGSGAAVVVTNELSAEDRAIYNPDDGVIYINNNADLTEKDVAKAVALHEVTHSTEGTKAYSKLVEQIKAIMQDKNAPASVKKILGDVNLRTVSTALGYEKDMESMSSKQAAYLVETEVNADLIGDLLSDDYFIEKLAERDMGLLQKLYNSFKNRANAKKSELGPDGIKYLKKLASKFGAAIEKRAGGVKISQVGDEDEKEEKKYSYETLTKKKDLVVVSFADKVPKKENGQIDSKSVLSEGRKNARAQANIRNTDTETYVRVDDIKIDVLIGAKGMQHGLARSEETAMAVMKIGDILKNSVAINELNGSTERQTEMSYVLLGACKDSENVYAVRTTVSKLNNNVTDIDIFQLGAVKGKKIETPNSALKRGAAVTELSSLISSESPIISIADFLEYVKDISLINEAFSQNVADNLGVTRSKGTLTNDLRYSRKRAYDPKNGQDETFEEVEGGVKIHFNDFEPHKSNDNSNDFEAAERARQESLDALLKNGEPPRYSPVSADKDTELLRRVVNNTKAKKYTRADVKAIVTELLSSEGYFGDNTVVMKGKKRAELEKMLWQALNTKGKGELGGAALDAAEYIIQNAIAVEYLEVTDDIQFAVQFVDALKPYLHNMNLDFIKGDIKAKFDKDNTPYLMWAVKKDGDFRGYTADEVAQELEALGFKIDKTNEADIFLEINELYRLAKQTITDAVPTRDTLLNALGTEKAKKLKQALAKDIINAQEEKGTETSFYKLQQKYIKQINELGEKVKTAHKRNTLENRILKEAKKIYDSNKHTFANATEVQTEALKNIKSLLTRVNSREQVNRSSLRAIMKELAIWYSEKNPVLDGFYDSYIAEHLAYFAESEVEETISEGEDNGQSRTPVPTPEKTENVKREKPLSMGELEMVQVILHHMNHVFENFGKMWRGGKYVEASDVASAQYEKLKEAEANHSSFEKAILHNKALRYIMDPMAVLAAWDGHDPDGYFTTTYREFAEGLIGQRWDEMQALAEFDEFRKTHKKYFKTLTNGNDKIKVSGRIDPRNLTISEIEIPKNVAIDLYMVSKTGQAIVTLEEVGYKVRIDGQHEQETMQTITKAQIEEMYSKFSEEDKELISIMERAYNGYCRDLKYNTDMKRLGFSNVFEGYYYPINRIGATDFDTDNFFQMMERVSNISANKSRVKGAKNAIIASNALTKFMRHVNAVARYANLAIPVENMNRVFNLDISGDKHMPTSIKMKLSENALWAGAEDYMKRLTDDVQQIGVKPDGGSKTISWLRGNYAKFQLGANPKVWFTQLSSYFAAFGELRASSLARAVAIDGSDVDKYCRLAAIRHYDKAATSAQTLTDKTGNVLTVPIEAVDRGVIRKLFAACQAEAQARYKLEIGTEENKIKAGEILTEVILKTQQNQLITEQSAAMRSTSEIIKSFTMFSADSMKLLSRFVQYMGEVATLNKRIKAANAKGDTALAEQLTVQRNKAVKSLIKSSVSILAVSVWMAALAKLFKLLYNKDDEEETVAEWLGEGTLGNIIGMVPFVRDAYSYFADGYDTDIFVTSMANDVLKSVSKTRDIFTAWVSGKEVTSEEFYSNIRSLAYSFGQIFGLPTRNVYNFTTGIIRRIDEGTGKSIDAWFKAPSESDAKASIREGIEDRDGSLTEYGLNQVYKKYEIEASDKALKSELDRLIKLNATKDEDDNTDYSPLGFKIPENLEIDGEDVELSAEKRKVFKNGLKSAEKTNATMVKTYYYRQLGDKYKAYAMRKVYEYYDLMSREELGAVSEARASMLYYGEAVGIDMLAVLMAYKQQLNGASDAEKAKRTKSTKELITEYLNKFNLTPVQKSLALRALGYSDKDNDKLVKAFIERRPGLSKEQRAEFLEIAKAG